MEKQKPQTRKHRGRLIYSSLIVVLAAYLLFDELRRISVGDATNWTYAAMLLWLLIITVNAQVIRQIMIGTYKTRAERIEEMKNGR